MTPPAILDLAIVVCTFHRAELLRTCLMSLVSQRVPSGFTVRIVVVDNSDDGSAAVVAAEVAATSPIPIRWIAAHPANISVARNAGVHATTEPHVAFIDDDTVCCTGWLEAIAAGLRAYPHDVFFGSVESNFEQPQLTTAAVRQLFSRQLPLDGGADLYPFGPRKTAGIALGTNNSIFRRTTTLCDTEPFDLIFGQSGGEDSDLFYRLQSQGCRFGWLPAATVSEFVPKSRCDRSYLWRRFFAGGQIFAAATARSARHVHLTRWWLRVRAAVQTVLLLSTLPVAFARGHDAVTDHSYRLAGALGKLSFGAVYPLYRHQPAPTTRSATQN